MHKGWSIFVLLIALLFMVAITPATSKEFEIKSNGVQVTILLDKLVTFKLPNGATMFGAMAVLTKLEDGEQMAVRYNLNVEDCNGPDKVMWATLPNTHDILVVVDGSDKPDSPVAQAHKAICEAIPTATKVKFDDVGVDPKKAT